MKSEQVRNNLYGEIISSLKARGNNQPWAETVESPSVSSAFPNVAAEWLASRYSIDTVASKAGVSPELLIASVNGGEALSIPEVSRLTVLWRCKREYLFSNTLQVIDPNTNKGKRIMRDAENLCRLFDKTVDEYEQDFRNAMDAMDGNGMLLWDSMKECLQRLTSLLDRLHHGQAVTYADYRNLIHKIDITIGCEKLLSTPVRCASWCAI